ncbi:hypothetical protein [Bacillus sp. RAR_GA_16]|uniref:hypothetical protein n=1 Tax=Bacillus sp. RAR_GA_16 TaxID=2876774 RepID=UPI001CC95D8C|nr:hypothetical protein [Bacillus sp. RAR_GA_16]MCA0171051.1 hypothetical protein [Bacillus sp. RAR_GA_16]
MYYFLYRTDDLNEKLRDELLHRIEFAVSKEENAYFINKTTHYLTVNYQNEPISITISDKQILLCSPNDFENGCSFTDFLINYLLDFFGPIYTLIE